MKAKCMSPGRLYKRITPAGLTQTIYFKFGTCDGNSIIVAEPGELDMQSSFGIDPDSEVTEVSDRVTGNACPVCSEGLEKIPDDHPNPVCRVNNLWCENCGWMGKYENS